MSIGDDIMSVIWQTSIKYYPSIHTLNEVFCLDSHCTSAMSQCAYGRFSKMNYSNMILFIDHYDRYIN